MVLVSPERESRHPGRAAVENGRTPDGEPYDWSKAGRAGAVRRR
ncbi:hypothetical protein ABE607_02020 [Comamonas aquatica]|nr:hypothetical protein [Comamonas aquatica]MDH1676282.1 hypothetical protein [Comamonas aquatica]MDH1679194.1 hypothetical protein [Comamonas aquatica]MDH1901947.1 hypothetical protein [Comamonas aquatica]